MLGKRNKREYQSKENNRQHRQKRIADERSKGESRKEKQSGVLDEI